MKLLAVSIMIFVFCLAFLVTIDLISGIPFPEAIRIIVESFTVVTVQEKIIVFVAVIIPFMIPFASIINKKKKQEFVPIEAKNLFRLPMMAKYNRNSTG